VTGGGVIGGSGGGTRVFRGRPHARASHDRDVQVIDWSSRRADGKVNPEPKTLDPKPKPQNPKP